MYRDQPRDSFSQCSYFYILLAEIDECHGENNCHNNATCKNVIGSYNCSCSDGFQGNGTHCEGKKVAFFLA